MFILIIQEGDNMAQSNSLSALETSLTPLMKAARSGHIDQVKQFIRTQSMQNMPPKLINLLLCTWSYPFYVCTLLKLQNLFIKVQRSVGIVIRFCNIAQDIFAVQNKVKF